MPSSLPEKQIQIFEFLKESCTFDLRDKKFTPLIFTLPQVPKMVSFPWKVMKVRQYAARHNMTQEDIVQMVRQHTLQDCHKFS